MHPNPKDSGFQRHVRACNNAELPGRRKSFLIGDQAVGWVPDRIALALEKRPEIRCLDDRVVLDEPAALPSIAHELAEQGLYRWRGEAFDVRVRSDGPVLARIDRGAIPSFGMQAVGVHVNGLVRRTGGLHMWIARRAMDKLLDPGKLDHVVAGGVPAGLGPLETLIKEAGEEAAIPPSLAATARRVSSFGYAMERPEGLRRDWLYCYDLTLPDDFLPRPVDGEVEAFELWPIERIVETVRNTDDFKFNVSLVLIDLFIRLGVIEAADPL
ncbi:MAG TPA: thiamine pyrophosphokinase [Acetobacteraceae bacterium]|nr:thiamine pyrophosphokinase [Acetobacteraceae bacterium]